MGSAPDAVGFGRVRRLLALDRNTVAVVGAMFLMALGENLWRRFLPKYLEALGAPILAIGAYGSAEDALDGLYQYPGGWASDRYGRRHALLLFVALAAVGYVVIAAAPAWPVVFVGLLLIMCWTSMASPTLFAVVGDALPTGRRSVGFSVQAILRRVPILVAPTLGGALIAVAGIRTGVRAGLLVSVALALVTLAVVRRMRLDRPAAPAPADITAVWRSLPGAAPATPGLGHLHPHVRRDGGRLPGALCRERRAHQRPGVRRPHRRADGDRHPVLAPGRAPRRSGRAKAFRDRHLRRLRGLPARRGRRYARWRGWSAAFVLGGLREIGEPARKALILDLVRPDLRARGVGLYYLLRSLAIAPAATVGGLLWKVSPTMPFLMAGAIGVVGVLLFTLTVDERHAG